MSTIAHDILTTYFSAYFSETVRVVVRVRPLFGKEIDEGRKAYVTDRRRLHLHRQRH